MQKDRRLLPERGIEFLTLAGRTPQWRPLKRRNGYKSSAVFGPAAS